MNRFNLSADLTGKHVLITGCGRNNGIGFAIAKCFAANGAQVTLHDVLQPDKYVEQFIQQHNANFIVMDLMPLGNGKTLIDKVADKYGAIDVMVLNASQQVLTSFEQQTEQDVFAQLRINLHANIEILQCLLPKMQQRRWGRVINIGSINQSRPNPIVSVYAAAKAANHNLIQSLSKTYAKDNVLLNTIAPGLIDTYPEHRINDEQAQQQWQSYCEQLNPMQRAGNTDEITGAALFLASDASAFMTGETLYLTGGQ